MSKVFPHNSSLKTARYVTSTFLWPPAFERTASVHLRVCTSSSLPRAAACGPAPQPRQRALRTGPQLQAPVGPAPFSCFPSPAFVAARPLAPPPASVGCSQAQPSSPSSLPRSSVPAPSFVLPSKTRSVS